MKIIKYKAFCCSDDFEIWQCQDVRKISSITPIPQEFDGSVADDHAELKASFGVFVTYFEEA